MLVRRDYASTRTEYLTDMRTPLWRFGFNIETTVQYAHWLMWEHLGREAVCRCISR